MKVREMEINEEHLHMKEIEGSHTLYTMIKCEVAKSLQGIEKERGEKETKCVPEKPFFSL